MASVVDIFNPEMIVVGGGVSAACDLFGGYAKEEVMKRAFPVPAQRCRITKAECGDDAGFWAPRCWRFKSANLLSATKRHKKHKRFDLSEPTKLNFSLEPFVPFCG